MRVEYWSLDFETTTDPEDCRVWVWGAYNILTDKFKWGTDIDDLIKLISRNNTKCYFHNLAFDGEFLMSWLFNHGYTYTEFEKCHPMEFSALISDMHQFYSMKINTGKHTIQILDSLKIIPLKVSAIPKAFGLDEAKGEIDYTLPREVGYVPTEEEISYLYHDVSIVAKALKFMFDRGLKKMTQASNALANFKEPIKNDFDCLFPYDFASDAFIRNSYKGGFTYLSPKFANMDIGAGLVFDVNSLYPSVMYNSLLPYGLPKPYVGKYEYDSEYPLYVQHISCIFKIKPNHIPTIMIKNSRLFSDNEYLESSDGMDVELFLTNVDLDLFLDHYDIKNLIYYDGYKFKGSYDIFKRYIDYWYREKEQAAIEHNAGRKQIAKLMLNSLYGKFGTSPYKANKIPYWDKEENRMRYKTSNPHIESALYVAMASFITAYARNKTIRAAQSVYPRFIYADTDSLHLVGTDIPENLDVHPTRLGAWDNELIFSKAKYLRSKCYIEYGHDPKTKDEDKLKITIAGLPESAREEVNFKTFKYGFESNCKLRTTRVSGGIVLMPTTFTIKEPKGK